MSLKLCAHTGTPTCPKNNKKALEELKYRDIVITNTEKGGAVVILDVKDYMKDKQHEHDRHLEHDPTTGNNATVNKVLKRIQKRQINQ